MIISILRECAITKTTDNILRNINSMIPQRNTDIHNSLTCHLKNFKKSIWISTSICWKDPKLPSKEQFNLWTSWDLASRKVTRNSQRASIGEIREWLLQQNSKILVGAAGHSRQLVLSNLNMLLNMVSCLISPNKCCSIVIIPIKDAKVDSWQMLISLCRN